MEGDEVLLARPMRIENKQVFVDLKQNANGVYLKLSSISQGRGRNTVITPAAGLTRLRDVLDEAIQADQLATGRGAGGVNAQPPRAPNPPNPCKIFVGNLTWDTDEAMLTGHMSSAGQIMEATIMKQRNGRSVGAGLVTFSSPAEASNAIATLHGTELDGREINCRPDKGN